MDANVKGIDVVISKVVEEHPVAIPLLKAGQYIGLMTAGAVYTSWFRGKFPLKITNLGGGHGMVMTGDMIDFLRTGESQASQNVRVKRVPSLIKSTGAGRPTKVLQAEAKRLNLSVCEYRAQQNLVGV